MNERHEESMANEKWKMANGKSSCLMMGRAGWNFGGAEGDRTPDLMTASHALSQLSYGP